MNSPGYQTTPDESGLKAGRSPIHRALFSSPETSFPGGHWLEIKVGFIDIILDLMTL